MGRGRVQQRLPRAQGREGNQSGSQHPMEFPQCRRLVEEVKRRGRHDGVEHPIVKGQLLGYLNRPGVSGHFVSELPTGWRGWD